MNSPEPSLWKATALAAAAVAAAVLGVLILKSVFTPREQEPQERPWYVGGTLHDCQVRDWPAASDRDRLATCADWSAALLLDRGHKPSLDEHRREAERLKVALDRAARAALPEGGDQRMSDLAAITWSLLHP